MMIKSPPSPPVGGEWVLMGHACVDSGTLAVIDPCYVIDKGADIYRWDDYANLSEPYCDNLGVQFSSGFGDGYYDVWGYVVDLGPGGLGGKRVCQVTVSLISDKDDEDIE